MQCTKSECVCTHKLLRLVFTEYTVFVTFYHEKQRTTKNLLLSKLSLFSQISSLVLSVAMLRLRTLHSTWFCVFLHVLKSTPPPNFVKFCQKKKKEHAPWILSLTNHVGAQPSSGLSLLFVFMLFRTIWETMLAFKINSATTYHHHRPQCALFEMFVSLWILGSRQ